MLGVEYDEKYPKYEDNLDKIRGFIKSLRKNLREAKNVQIQTKLHNDQSVSKQTSS